MFVLFICLAPGVVPLDLGRDSVQNDGRMTSVALIWVPFVPLFVFEKTIVIETQFYASRARNMSRARQHILHRIIITWSRTREKVPPQGMPPI